MRVRAGSRPVLNAAIIGGLCLGLAAAAGRPPAASALQPSIEDFVVNDDRGNQRVPRVSGKWVVFADDRQASSGSNGADIRSWHEDDDDTRNLTEDPIGDHPAVSGNLAAWAERPSNETLRIVVYDLEEREVVRRIERSNDQDYPSISGQKVVWQERSGSDWDVQGYDLEQRRRFTVSEASADQTRPSIDGNLVAFEDSRDDEIWYRELDTDRLRKIEGRGGFEPSVSGKRIAFRSGGTRDNQENANIYVFDVGTNTLSAGLATTLDGKRGNPRIHGDLVVWWDNRHGDRDIYGYDLATKTEFRIVDDDDDQEEPDVSDGVVVWADRGGSGWDVRGARVGRAQATPTPSPTSNATATPAPTVIPLPTPSAPSGQTPRDDRFFAQSGFRIDNDRFWEYFELRGGVKNFGYPASRTFRFMGFTTQFFQRHIMQLGPNGAQLMNLLDPGLMPYTQINTSTFPAFDQTVVNQAPQVGSPSYDTRIVEFIRQNAPDAFGGQSVSFYSTFVNQVDLATAFPSGNGNPSLIPLINLELAGSVTSRPMADPRNGGFIYQRFQRAILHYDASCACTQPILLGEWFKAIITGRGLPTDLAGQAQASPFYLQYNNSAPNGLNRPLSLPDTDMRFAFEQQ